MKTGRMILIFIIIAAAAITGFYSNFKEMPTEAIGIYDIFNCSGDSDCMDQKAEQLLQIKNQRQLLAELDELGKTDNAILIQCHPITHAIGRMTYKLASNVGEAFQKCDHTCHSGCFHGVMERVFLGDNTDEHITPQMIREKTPDVCESFAQGLYGNIRFQCLHGLGHAVVFFSDYNLTESLKLCDLLATEWDQRSCYGGAFMENVVAVNKSKRYVSDDPHFPCNAIDDKYRQDCYLMQTSRMLEMGLSYEQMAKECEKAADYRNVCMQSIGRDASNDARKDPRSVSICTSLSDSDNRFCIAGLVYAVADNSWDGRYAFPYCDNINESYTQYCYETTIRHLKHSLFINQSHHHRQLQDLFLLL